MPATKPMIVVVDISPAFSRSPERKGILCESAGRGNTFAKPCAQCCPCFSRTGRLHHTVIAVDCPARPRVAAVLARGM